jgi:hypothetical protein
LPPLVVHRGRAIPPFDAYAHGFYDLFGQRFVVPDEFVIVA